MVELLGEMGCLSLRREAGSGHPWGREASISRSWLTGAVVGFGGTEQLTTKFTFLSGIRKLVCCRDKQLDAAVSFTVEGMTW